METSAPLLQDVTLNPMMGQLLSMLGNDKGNANTDPDENYAREVMQLFTIGLYQLNDDGSQKLDPTGQPNPDLLQHRREGWQRSSPASAGTSRETIVTPHGRTAAYTSAPDYGEDLLPMQSFPSHHSTVKKIFSASPFRSGSADPVGDLKIALDTLFNHPNLPPFFCKQMIQHLVTSNPSPDVHRQLLAAVFKDNGTGVRGDLQAVITEILLDPEARNSSTDFSNPQYGKVREALLRYTEWARAFTAQSRTGSMASAAPRIRSAGLGEMSLRSPTVFNWFAPGYVPPGTTIAQAGLVAPEMQMTNVTTVVAT